MNEIFFFLSITNRGGASRPRVSRPRVCVCPSLSFPAALFSVYGSPLFLASPLSLSSRPGHAKVRCCDDKHRWGGRCLEKGARAGHSLISPSRFLFILSSGKLFGMRGGINVALQAKKPIRKQTQQQQTNVQKNKKKT